jgi:predicted sugar kinase
MTESRFLDPEDEAFNEIERQAKQRKESVMAALEPYLDVYKNPSRNDTIEEVAQHIEKLQGFGKDTISSLAIYIRSLKK